MRMASRLNTSLSKTINIHCKNLGVTLPITLSHIPNPQTNKTKLKLSLYLYLPLR